MNKIAVTIPVYKKKPTISEIKSLQQCVRILSKRHFVFFAGNSFDASFYENVCSDKVSFHIERFDDIFFKNVIGYNRLMLSQQFYKRFLQIKYLFIYQLDSFIFKDDLDYWCDLDYDNVGAPWFVGFDKPEQPYVFLGAGNGGCTLRKTSSCHRILTTFKYLDNPFKIFQQNKSLIKLIKDITIQNNFYYRLNNFELNEDYFFASKAAEKFKWFRNCPPEKSVQFSFEVAPSFLFKLNNYRLPMCCHGWEKYEYDFWKPFIEKASN
jgi:hypothetical protein